jgi:hypothetical protein
MLGFCADKVGAKSLLSRKRLPKSEEIRPKLHLARSLQFLLHRRRMVRGQSSGTKTMTFNLTGLQSITVSLFGALVAASLLISAAVGPAVQLV